MIRGFKHKGLLELWQTGKSRSFPANQVNKIMMMLEMINFARKVPQDFVLLKNWRIHPLRGQLEGYWSLTVNRNYRLVFRFENSWAFDIDYIDYH